MSAPAARSKRSLAFLAVFPLLGILGLSLFVGAQTRELSAVVHRYCDEVRRGGPGSPLSAGFADHLAHAGPTPEEAAVLARIRASKAESFHETSGDSDTACYGANLEGAERVWLGLRKEGGAWTVNQLGLQPIGGCGDDG